MAQISLAFLLLAFYIFGKSFVMFYSALFTQMNKYYPHLRFKKRISLITFVFNEVLESGENVILDK